MDFNPIETSTPISSPTKATMPAEQGAPKKKEKISLQERRRARLANVPRLELVPQKKKDIFREHLRKCKCNTFNIDDCVC